MRLAPIMLLAIFFVCIYSPTLLYGYQPHEDDLVRISVIINGERYVYYVKSGHEYSSHLAGRIRINLRGVIETPTFSREDGVWPVILNGSQLPELVGLSYGNIRVLYYNATTQEWVEVPYQIDERGYSYEIVDYDSSPVYDWVFTYIRWGAQELGPGGSADPNQMSRKFDNDDEIVFYVYNGSRVDESTWWNTSYPYRIEVKIIDPVDNGQCWMYIYYNNESAIVEPNPYEDTDMDYVDWFYNNLTVRTPYYVMAINTSNPDLISYVRPLSAPSNFMKEGLKDWLTVNGTYNTGVTQLNFEKDCNREGTWDAYYTEVKTNVGYLNGQDIRNEAVGNGTAISDGPVRVIVNTSSFINVTTSVGTYTITKTEVLHNIYFFYKKFRGYPYKIKIEESEDPNVQNEKVKYVFSDVNHFAQAMIGSTRMYLGNYTQGGYFGVNILDGDGTDDYYTSGGDPWTPNLAPIRNNDDIPEWIVINNSFMLEFIYFPYLILLDIKQNASGVYMYWKDEPTITEFGVVVEALDIPVNTMTVFIADAITKLEGATSTTEINNMGQKWFQYFNETKLYLRDEETLTSDIVFLSTETTSQSTPQDTNPPVVTIDEPENNSIVGGSTVIQVSSSDENPDTTWLTIDGNTVATWSGAGTFTYDWDTTGYSDGEHQIVAYANDTAGNIGSYSIIVTVDNMPPSVTIDQPQDGSYVKGTITIQVTSDDSHPNTTWLEIDGNIVDSWSGSGTFAYSWDTTSVDDGTHQIVAYANDSVGNLANQSIVVTVDNTPPDVSITDPQNNSLVSGTVNIHVNSSDQNPDTTWLEINGTVVQTWGGEGTFTYSWDTTSYSDGVYEIVAYANDSAGNIKSYKIYVEVDNTPPSVTIDSPANNSVVSGVVDVIVASNDPHNDTTWLTINGTIVQTWSGAGTFTYSWNTTAYENGYYELVAYANDTLGNMDSYRIIIEVANEALSVSITTPSNNSVVGGIINITVTSSSANTTWLVIDGTSRQYWSDSGTFIYQWNTTIESEGQHEIVAYANDTEGNIASYRILVVVDNTPPNVIINTPANESLLSGIVTISISSSDSHADTTWLEINSSAVQYWPGDGTFSYSWDTGTYSDGDYEIRAYANDTAGNTAYYSIIVTVDNTPPQVTISNPTNNSVVGGVVVIEIVSSDAHPNITWLEINGSLVQYWPGDGTFTYSWDTESVSDGTYKIAAFANDTLGNIASYTIFVDVDNSPPSVVINAPVNNSVVGGVVTIELSSDDPHGDNTWLIIDDALVQTWSGCGTYTYDWNSNSVADGNHEIKAHANDTVGNTAYYRIIVEVDNTQPNVVINSPQNNSIVNGTITIELSSSDLHPDKTWLDIDDATVSIWDGSGTFTYQWDTTSVTDGNHEIVAYANDTVGNVGTYSIIVTVDNTPPSVTITSPDNDSTVGTTFDVTWDASDQATDIEKVEVYLNGTLEATYVKDVNMTNTHTFENLEAGKDYLVNITVYDSAGWSSSDEILVHTSGFFISILSPSNWDAFNTTWVVVEWDYGQIDTVTILLNGTPHATVPASTRSYNITNLYESVWNITLVGTNATTLEQTSDTVMIYIDMTPPYVNILTPKDDELLNTSDVYVEWEGYDQETSGSSGIDHYEVRADDGAWINVGTATSYTITLTEGSHRIYVRVYDRAGNVALDYVDITVDTTPPSIAITSPNNNSYIASNNIAIGWDASDNYGIDHFEIKWDSGARSDIGLRFSYTIQGLVEGEHNITVYAIDKAGNVAFSTITIYVDMTHPTITITSPSSTLITNQTSITIEWTGSDNLGIDHYELRIDRGAWIDIGSSTSHTVVLSEGEHVVCIRAVDHAGLCVQRYVYIIVDITPPIISLESPENNSYINSPNVTIHWNVSDNYAYRSSSIRINGGEWINIGREVSYYLTNLDEGEHVLEIVARDYAGNAAKIILIFTIDLTDPQLQILTPIDGSILTSENITVEWNGSDNVGLDYYEIRLSNGDWINVGLSTEYTFTGLDSGVYVIYLMAVDKAKNKATAYITVRVQASNKAKKLIPNNETNIEHVLFCEYGNREIENKSSTHISLRVKNNVSMTIIDHQNREPIPQPCHNKWSTIENFLVDPVATILKPTIDPAPYAPRQKSLISPRLIQFHT